ncbi:MAG: DUF192 domain-containing protein [Puniceicoccales bacterium]|nr:DUF192 domain-containing protein [Puniceicoccales bacterium]
MGTALVLPCACGQEDGVEQSVPAQAVDFSKRFSILLSGKTIHVQVALTDLETTRGLMGRKALDADEGMLFLFPHSQQRGFWMRNVPINLALGFFTTDGRLDEVKTLFAENPETVPSRSNEIRYVLEMREGWFDANGVHPGAMLDMQTVRTAVRARGFKVENFLGNTAP